MNSTAPATCPAPVAGWDSAAAETAVERVRVWFDAYTRTFAGPDGVLQPMLQLKHDHTRRVAANAGRIAAELGWSENAVRLGEIAGWLHDAGRFPQFSEFRTFEDRRSLNHAAKSLEVVRAENVLDGLPDGIRAQIETAVAGHNLREVPQELPAGHAAVLRLVRDADKLDIFHVVGEAMDANLLHLYPEIVLHLDLRGAPNPVILEAFQRRGTVHYRDIHSVADFLLIQLLWLYDINFTPTVRFMLERNVIGTIRRHLPAFPEKESILERVAADAHRRCGLPPP